MLCEKCNQREATVHLNKIINNHKTEMYLCDVCASQEGVGNFYINPMDSLFANFFNDSLNISDDLIMPNGGRENQRRQRHCPNCGMTEEKLFKNGKLGCAECYEVFKDKLDELLKQIHGNNVHCGKKPRTAIRAENKSLAVNDEIEQLKIKMQKAIEQEDFEQAAVLRDKIKASRLSGQKGGEGDAKGNDK